MGVLRDRLNAKLRRNVVKSPPIQTSSPTSTPSQTPSTSPQQISLTEPNGTATNSQSSSFSILRFRPKSNASSAYSQSTFQATTTKIKRILRPNKTTSHVSNASLHLDDVPEPEPHLLPLADADPSSLEHPSDTPLTDGHVSITVPTAWRAVRADDAIYLLSGSGVGFVKAVRAVDACQVLLEVGRLSVMSHVVVGSSPVWIGCEATVKYNLDGGFGIGVARFENGFEGGAVVFAFCAPAENKDLVLDAVKSVRATAKVVKIPEMEADNKEDKIEEKQESKSGKELELEKNDQNDTICVIQ